MNLSAITCRLIFLLLFPVASALAIPSTLRTAEGRIVAVEPANRRFTFERGDNHKQIVLTWDRRTLFRQRGAIGEPAALRAGQRAQVGYRLPLFGPDYASRVNLLPAAPASRHRFPRSSKSKHQSYP